MQLLILGFKETREIAKKVAYALRGKYCEADVDKFPDNESHIKIKENPAGKTVVLISSFAHDPNKKLVEAVLVGNLAKDNGAKKVILIATYLPYMRQDTHFEKYDAFSAKAILKYFSEFDEVLAIDPHLHRIQHLSDIAKNMREISVRTLIAFYIKARFKNKFIIVGPDSESQQWSRKIARILGEKVVILNKRRFSSEKVAVEKRKLGKNVLIIDDIISTGHTLLETIEMARKQGAKKIVCIGIHGIFVEECDKKIRKYAELITTNTIPNKYSKIDVSPAIVSELRRIL